MDATMDSHYSLDFEITTSLKVLLSSAAILIFAIGAFGNISVIIAVARSKKLRTVSNIFTVSLIGLSFMIICYGYPLQLLMDVFLIQSQPWCYLLGSSMLSLSVQFTLVLILVTLERYITICQPFRAHAIFTPRNVTMTVSILMVYGLLIGMGAGGLIWMGKDDLWMENRRCNLIFIIPSKQYILLLMAHWLLPLPVMIMVYIHIFMVVRRHLRKISALMPTTVGTVSNPAAPAQSQVDDSATPTNRIVTHGRLIREAKSAIVLFVIVLTYFLCWVPFSIFVLTGILSGDGVSPGSFVIIHCIVYSCGFITPYVYGFGNKQFRVTLLAMFLPRACGLGHDDHNSIPTITTDDR